MKIVYTFLIAALFASCSGNNANKESENNTKSVPEISDDQDLDEEDNQPYICNSEDGVVNIESDMLY